MSTNPSTKPCLFCQHQSRYYQVADRFMHNYYCDYCGEYWIDEMALYRINPGEMARHSTGSALDTTTLLQIAGVLAERRHKGLPSPFFITDNEERLIYTEGTKKGILGITTNIDKILQEYPKNAIDLFDRILINLSSCIQKMSPLSPIEFPDKSSLSAFYATGKGGLDIVKNCETTIDEMANLGYIRILSTNPIFGDNFGTLKPPIKVIISTNGWKRIQELQHTPAGNKRQAFVAMWFDKSRNDYYENGISKAIAAAHSPDFAVVPLRIDHTEHNEKICSQIIENIRQSCYVIADVTGNNAGAYYEAGFAQGMGKPVIWAMDERFFKETPMHFDVRQYNTVIYNSVDELRDRLETRIRATIPSNLIASSAKSTT